jgi:hypothetical protein
MRWLNKIVATGLLLLWTPATSLCLIQRTGWPSHDDCCPSSSAKTPPCKPASESACCALASATCKSHFHERLTPKVPVFASLAIVTAADPDEGLTRTVFVPKHLLPLKGASIRRVQIRGLFQCKAGDCAGASLMHPDGLQSNPPTLDRNAKRSALNANAGLTAVVRVRTNSRRFSLFRRTNQVREIAGS